MRKTLLTLAAILAPFGAIAQDLTPFQGVISNQLRAFQSEDVDQAWSYASPSIQGIFGSAENFGVMVQRGYPMVWDNAGADFLENEEVSGAVFQRVRITDERGVQHDLLYQMIPGPDGWRINGVQLLPKPDLGV